jgi:hypothetical protein
MYIKTLVSPFYSAAAKLYHLVKLGSVNTHTKNKTKKKQP